MCDFTPSPRPRHTHNLFLIGCGFTAAVFEDAPLNEELVRILIEERPSSPLALYQSAYRTHDIETLLTYLDLEINSSPDGSLSAVGRRLKADRKAIDRELADFFMRFRYGKSNNTIVSGTKGAWLEKFATEVLNRNDVAITLNYDCFLEGLLDLHSVWSPSTGYGPFIRLSVPGTLVGKTPNPKGIIVYKIHGSENFRSVPEYLDRTQEAWAIVNAEIFPRSGVDADLDVRGDDAHSRIIAPSFVKHFPRQMQQMMIAAVDAARTATNVIVIGCGLRPEDGHVWLLLSSFIGAETRSKRIIVVDKNAEAIRDKIHKQYGTDIQIDVLGQGRGLDECATVELITRLRAHDP